jgi:poly(3-hydroxybutyrate) depolymerase
MTAHLVNEPLVDDIAERVRAVVARLPGQGIGIPAETLRVSSARLEELARNRDDVIDIVFLIDVIAALVHQVGIDPKWLLTGQYDSAMHRQALLLGEDRTAAGAGVMRNFVEEEFRRLRSDVMLYGGSAAAAALET